MTVVQYERVRFSGRTVILKNTREVQLLGAPALTGIEVDREGSEIASVGHDERLHIIALDQITKRTPLRFNNHYGMLEEAK